MNKLFLLFIYFLSIQVGLTQDQPFDEVYGDSGTLKEVRPVYQEVIEHYEKLSNAEKEKLAKRTLRDFQGDNTLLPLPRVLSDLEFKVIKKGVEQRGKALSAFLRDHYSGKKSYLQAKIIPEAVISRVITRARETEWEQYVRPKNLNFWYGPDVIRGPPEDGFPEGRFYVVEDNPSFIGGMGDLVRAREILDKEMPVYGEVTKSPHPQSFYDDLFKSYKNEAKKYGGIALSVQYPASLAADKEDTRVAKLMEEAGIEVIRIDPNTNNSQWRKNKRIQVDKKGTWLETLQENGKIRRRKVGYIVSNMNPQEIELSHPGNWKYRLFQEAEWELEQKNLPARYKNKLKKLLNTQDIDGEINYLAIEKLIKEESPYETSLTKKQIGIPGVLEQVFQGHVGMTNSPGIEFIGDKEFYLYIEDMIKFYLNEEAILKNMKTQSFSRFNSGGKEKLDEKALKHVMASLDKYVIKGVDGRGGDAVWVGPKIKKSEIPALVKRIKENPGRYIFQAYTALSTMVGHIGDLRLISDVSGSKVRVANIPWARVVGVNGDGKVNISANGSEATVMVRKMSKEVNCFSGLAVLLN